VPRTLRAWVDVALEAIVDDWRTALARRLADELEVEPNASMARELRALMAQIDAERPEVRDAGDELRAKRAERLAQAADQ
jgi:transcriptional regulator GlxA family with amidase domain